MLSSINKTLFGELEELIKERTLDKQDRYIQAFEF